MPQPPALDIELGLASYLTTTPGIGGRLRYEPEDFRVIELTDGPKIGDGKFTAARIRLRNWETNRFVRIAGQRLNLRPGAIAFAGMKDKRAVTEQWFSFKCHPERLEKLGELEDVEVLEVRSTPRAWFRGGHDGNRFVLRVREHEGDEATVAECLDQIKAEGGVPHFFGPQRFGSGVRPITHLMGKAIVAGELEEAVRLYCGQPTDGEREDTYAARKCYEDTRDPAATLELMPRQMDHECAILRRLIDKPGDWGFALAAMPHNLRSLFVHAHQSWVFNHILTARLEAGLGVTTAHIGDLVMPVDGDGVTTIPVTEFNQARVQEELDLGRAMVTAPLPGLDNQSATGKPGEIEAEVLERLGIHPRDFRCHDMPEVASKGLRRGVLQHVSDLQLEWVEGDPVVSFGLGRGSYATVVMREVMKAEPSAY